MKALRTPDSQFQNLPGYNFQPNYCDVDDLRMHYVDENPDGDETVVMLHGEPSWSYLYRKMIPRFAAAGHRAIAPDLIGFGRSDKPEKQEDYTYQKHIDWMKALLFEHLNLQDITLFVQDWGGLIGLRLVAENPEKFKRLVIANTFLPTGDQGANDAFMQWQKLSQTIEIFDVGRIINKATVSPLSPEVIAAYDSPFPDERYKSGARIFPMLVPITPDNPASASNRAAWQKLVTFDKPVLTLFSDKDPIMSGLDRIFQSKLPGAAGQPHDTIRDAGHFLQEDKGEEIADKITAFIAAS
ncbi:MAG: haloalkane dehalogenase [Calditrichia bacterium]